MDIITHRLMMASSKKMIITPLFSSSNQSDLSTYNYTSVPLGDENNSRWIVVCSGATDTANTTPSTCVINGVSATLASNARHYASSNQSSSQIWYAKVPTGTSVTITITYSSAQLGNAISVFSLLGDALLGDTSSITSGSVLTTSTLSVPANGVVFACLTMYTGNNGTTASWSPESITPQTLYVTGGTGGKSQVAYGTTAGSYSVQATLSTGTTTSALSVAVFYEA